MRSLSTAQSLTRGFALAGAFPLLILALLSIGLEMRHVLDPCFRWGVTGSQSYTRDELIRCGGRTGGTSQSKTGVIIRLTLVQGSAFMAAILALKGGYRGRPRLTLAASMMMFALTVPLVIGQFGLMSLICALCFLLSYFCSYLIPTTRYLG